MKYIFLDESGELGFHSESSKFFIITLLVCNEDTTISLRRIIKKVRQKKLRKKIKKISELKGNNSSDDIRNYILNHASKEPIEILTIVLEKSKVYEYLQSKKNKLYNYMSNLILTECSLDDDNIKIIVDRSYGKFLAGEFNRYIKNNLISKNKACNITIEHIDSKNEGVLQVLDFISWAIFRKYEYKEQSFYDIVREQITTEKVMFSDPRG